MATRTDCPKDGHGRFLVGDRPGLPGGQTRLNCSVKACRCADCHKVLSAQERKDWIGPP